MLDHTKIQDSKFRLSLQKDKLISLYLILIVFVFSCQSRNDSRLGKPEQLQDGISISSMDEEGIRTELISDMIDSIAKNVYPNIHSVLIARNNHLVFEKYFAGEDREIGFGTFQRSSHMDSLHDIRSVSKSITGLAVLVALQNGLLESLDKKVFDFFPEMKQYKTGYKANITVRHLMTMTDGMQWNEVASYADSANSEIQMNWHVDDPIEYYFSRSSIHKPGTVFNYSGGCTQILASIIQKVSGLTIDQYVAKYIFDPLAIDSFEWKTRKNGVHLAAAGLRMRSRDMLKIGLLYLNEGTWDSKSIIKKELIEDACQAHINAEPGYDYGYQVWLPKDTSQYVPVTRIAASGNGGQLIIINRANRTIVVITAGNYESRNVSWEQVYLKRIEPAFSSP